MKNMLSVLFVIFPVMFYYALESAFIALFVNPIWNWVLEPKFNIHLNYLHWFVGVWILRMVFLDVFKIVGSINGIIITQKEMETSKNNNTYNAN